jgi:hypothetical protein
MVKLIFDGWAVIDGLITREYQAKPDERILLCLFSSPSAYFFDQIEFCGGKLRSSEGLEIIDWGDVIFLRAKKILPAPPLALSRKNGTLSGIEYLLTVYKDNTIKFLLETKDNHHFYAPKTEIFKPEVFVRATKNSLLFTVKAKCDEGDYVWIISAGDLRVLFEDSGQSIRFKNNTFTIRKTYEDMCMREKTSVYALDGENFVLKSNMFKYANEHIYIDELKPYLLLEALLADDYEYMRMLLTDDLAEKAETLKEYFGSIASIESPDYSKADADVAVISRDGVARCYKFEFSDGNISNISLSE